MLPLRAKTKGRPTCLSSGQSVPERIANLARERRLPAGFDHGAPLRMLAVFDVVWRGAYGADGPALFRQVAKVLLHRILQGPKPSDVPYLSSSPEFELAINLRRPRQLGLEVGRRSSQRAERGDRIVWINLWWSFHHPLALDFL